MAMKQGIVPIDKAHYHYWQAFYLAFFSPKIYVDAAKRWRGMGLFYVLLLVLLLAIPTWMRLCADFDRFMMEDIREPLRAMPTIYVQKGHITVDRQMPFFVRNQSGEVVIIIDTSGKIKTMDTQRYPHMWALFSQDSLIYRTPQAPLYFVKNALPEKPPQTLQLPKDLNQVFDVQAWEKIAHLNALQWEARAVLYLALVFTFFVLYAVFIAVVGMMFQLFTQVLFKVMMGYCAVCRIMAIASTVPLSGFFVLLASDRIFPFSGWFLLGILLIYYSFGILACKREGQKLVR